MMIHGLTIAYVAVAASFGTLVTFACAADDIRSLQGEIDQYLLIPEIQSKIATQNRLLDQMCEMQAVPASAEFVRTLEGGTQLKNYAEILPGISRFEFPSFDALMAAHQQKVCDQVVTLNRECLLSEFDANRDGTLSTQEESVAKPILADQGFPAPAIDQLLSFYRMNGQVCVSAKVNEWHVVLPLQFPEKSIAETFSALEMILNAKKSKSTICFHCHVGKHRTGLVAMLVEIANLPSIDARSLEPIFESYFQHAWFHGCMSRVQTVEIVTMIVRSKPFQSFRARWQTH